MSLLPHQQRVIEEKAELDGKIEKLQAFTQTKIFHDLDAAETVRLIHQLSVMGEYSRVLSDRIQAFKE